MAEEAKNNGGEGAVVPAHSHGGELSLEPDASDSSISVRIYLPDVLSSVPAKEKRSFKEALRRG